MNVRTDKSKLAKEVEHGAKGKVLRWQVHCIPKGVAVYGAWHGSRREGYIDGASEEPQGSVLHIGTGDAPYENPEY